MHLLSKKHLASLMMKHYMLEQAEATSGAIFQATLPAAGSEQPTASPADLRDPQYLKRKVAATPALFTQVAQTIQQAKERRASLGRLSTSVRPVIRSEVLQAVVKSSPVQSLVRRWLAENEPALPTSGSAATARELRPQPTSAAPSLPPTRHAPVIDLEPDKIVAARSTAPRTSQTLLPSHSSAPPALQQTVAEGRNVSGGGAAVRRNATADQPQAAQPPTERSVRITLAPQSVNAHSSGSAPGGQQPSSPPALLRQPTQHPFSSSSFRPVTSETAEGFRNLSRGGNQQVVSSGQDNRSQPSNSTAPSQAAQQKAPQPAAITPLSARRDPRLHSQSPRGTAPRGTAQALGTAQQPNENPSGGSFGGRQNSDPLRQSSMPRQNSFSRQGSLLRQNSQSSGGSSQLGRRAALPELPEAAGEKESAWRVSHAGIMSKSALCVKQV